MTATSPNPFPDIKLGRNQPDRRNSGQRGFVRMRRVVQVKLVATRLGRITLHVCVALQTGHFLWHWRGIVRELVHI